MGALPGAFADSASRSRPSETPLTPVEGFGTNPGALRMFTYVPRTLLPSPPLVVVLHGCTQDAAGYNDGAGWSTLADRHGFVLLFAEQPGANNPKTCFNWFVPGDIARGGGEALSVRQMIERAAVDHDVDRSRVYVTGLSAGGAMTAVMLATYPEIFAGGAVIAGLPYGAAGNVQEALQAMFKGHAQSAATWGDVVRAASPHAGPWPRVSVWHGSRDATVVPMNAGELVKQWTDVHGLSVQDGLRETLDGHSRQVWRDAAGREVVESVIVAGMGHGTPLDTGPGPTQCGQAGPFLIEAGVSSSYQIAKFWGLTAVTLTAADAPAPSARAPGPAPDRAKPEPAFARDEGPSASMGSPDVMTVIQKALRSAGLIKS